VHATFGDSLVHHDDARYSGDSGITSWNVALWYICRSRDVVFGTQDCYAWTVWGSNSSRKRDFLFSNTIQIGFEPHTASCSMNTVVCYCAKKPGVKLISHVYLVTTLRISGAKHPYTKLHTALPFFTTYSSSVSSKLCTFTLKISIYIQLWA
jgi:hypothetical protein